MSSREQLTTFLQNVLGVAKFHGNGEELYFHCKFCNHKNPKLAVNVSTYKWHCWHCNEKGSKLYSLFRKLNIDRKLVQELRQILQDVPAYVPTEDTKIVYLPDEFHSLKQPKGTMYEGHVLNYLYSRGITDDDIHRYNIGYCETGEYANRVIVPSYDENNQLNFFIARDIFGNSYRYKNPPYSKDVVFFENQINWNHPVVIVEGVFDAIAVRRNAIPIQGKIINKRTIHKLVTNGVEDLILALDRDALKEIVKQADWLMRQGFNIKIVDMQYGKDPSEMGFQKTQELIKRATPIDFMSLIKLKMN